MIKSITLDMDGTFVDLYGVENWLEDLRAECVRPYVAARSLVNLSSLARVLNILHRKGWTINIVSWTSRGGSLEYNKAVAAAKREWLARHMPSVKFDNIYIIDYGTPKSIYGNGILFDDEERNRNEWPGPAYSEKNLIFNLMALYK